MDADVDLWFNEVSEANEIGTFVDTLALEHSRVFSPISYSWQVQGGSFKAGHYFRTLPSLGSYVFRRNLN